MLQRESAIEEIKERIKAAKDIIGIKSLKHNPDSPATKDQIPGVFIHEGDDVIVKSGTWTWSGYPAMRKMDVYFEILNTGGKVEIKGMYRKLRDAIFQAPLECKASIKEIKAFGPSSNGAAGVMFMQLVISLVYTDQGPTN